MNNDTFINYIDYYIPQNYISIDDVFAQLDNNIFESRNIDRNAFCKRFKNDTKLDKISVFNEQQDLVSLVSVMVDKLLKEVKIDPLDIDYLVCGNEVLLKYNKSSIMHYIQQEFNMKNSVILPLLQPCAASLFAMGLSRDLLNKPKKYMLIITACKWDSIQNRFIDFSIRGDGIGLVLVGNDTGSLRIAGWNSANLGSSSYGKIKNKCENQDISKQRNDMISGGVAFFQDSLKKLNINEGKIDKIIPPNVRYDVYYELYSHYLNLDPDIFYLDNVPNGGHMCDIDLIRNLKDYISGKTINNMQNIVMYTPDVEQSFDVNYHFVLLNKNNA